MTISRIMTRNPIFSHPEMSVNEVRSIMEKERIGHVPVLDKDNNLVGLITGKDILKAGPSAATSLDIYEISYLLSKVTVKDVMEKNVITVGEDEVMEEAARIMADRGIGCLPVMRGTLLVGIITDTDLFHVFVNAFGARHHGVRITCSMQEKPGQMVKLSQAVAEHGGNIVSFITFEGDDLASRRITAKIGGLNKEKLDELIRTVPDVILEDIR